MEINIPFIEKILDIIAEWLKRDRRKALPYDYVTVGTYKIEHLAVDIRAKIVLDEITQPSIDLFLERISTGNPYCPHCQRPLDEDHLDWMGDFAQIGYTCSECQTKIKRDRMELWNDVQGEVRKRFGVYYETYKSQVHKLTKGKPDKYKIVIS
ncbi:MAG: hypothetical protein QME90_16920 [Thermodesulfobacteriota bacterium]|nr:hypothetical protein [Thermodesulfobacteriota bacterium]